ncbi:hypothetical protein [Streptomyces sp. NPDC003327]
MRDRGLTWPARPEPLGEGRGANERRYGIGDAAPAAAYGYQLPPPPGVTRTEQYRWEQRSRARLDGVDRAVIDAYTGERGGGRGCRDVARDAPAMRWVYAGDPVGAASGAAWARSKADRRILALVAEWSRCMRTAGHTQPDPLTAAGAWAGSGRPADGPMGAPSAAEVSTALAVVRCRGSVDYAARRHAVEVGYQNAEITARSAALRSYRDAWRATVRAARAVSVQ